jgi:DNA-binding transcriptional MerR regulator
MYRTGTVARLALVSVRTLRYYDDLGLLKPAHTDPLTGYRRYTPDQVLRLAILVSPRTSPPSAGREQRQAGVIGS